MEASQRKTILSAWRSGDVERAKRLLDIPDEELDSRLLVLKGKCLQIAKEPVALDGVKKCFLKALSMDPSCVPALLELGWFLRNVENDPKGALRYFQKAYRLTSQFLRESISGVALSKDELSP